MGTFITAIQWNLIVFVFPESIAIIWKDSVFK